MIKAAYEGEDGRRHYVFGLSHANLERLRRENPIRFDLAEIGGEGTIFIFAAESEEKIEHMFRQAGVIGPETKIRNRPRPS